MVEPYHLRFILMGAIAYSLKCDKDSYGLRNVFSQWPHFVPARIAVMILTASS